jgi:hypothetical protein
MCFSSTTTDDPTQAPRRTGLFHPKMTDPTQQPIYIAEPVEGSKSDPVPQGLKKRLGSYKSRAASVAVTDQEQKSTTKRPSNTETMTIRSSKTEAVVGPAGGMPEDHPHWGGRNLPFGIGIGVASGD